MKRIAIHSIKGGVGKTAAAVNLAHLSAVEGGRTLLWDLDPQSSATFYLRVQPKIRGGGRQLIRKRTDPEGHVKGTDFDGFDLLPGDFSYRRFELLLGATGKAVKRIENLFRALGEQYDYLILDCPPGFSIVSEGVIHLTDLVAIPTIPTPLSMRTLELIDRQCGKRGWDRSKVRPFFSMVDRRKSLHRSLCDHPVEGAFRYFRTRIPYATVVERMGLHRAPVAVFAAQSPAAAAFRSLWREMRDAL
jgi:chromosome partitioning protein